MIYLDNAATTKVTDEVFESIIPYFYEVYANPSAIYSFAARAARQWMMQERRLPL